MAHSGVNLYPRGDAFNWRCQYPPSLQEAARYLEWEGQGNQVNDGWVQWVPGGGAPAADQAGRSGRAPLVRVHAVRQILPAGRARFPRTATRTRNQDKDDGQGGQGRSGAAGGPGGAAGGRSHRYRPY